jgi:hypothetical protein
MQKRHMLIVALVIALSAFAGPVLAIAAAAPVPGNVVLVVVPSGPVDRDALVRAAGGTPIGPSQAPLGGLAASDAPDLAERLYKQGAWLVLDAARLARICGLEP